jgi:hypothetical protein
MNPQEPFEQPDGRFQADAVDDGQFMLDLDG